MQAEKRWNIALPHGWARGVEQLQPPSHLPAVCVSVRYKMPDKTLYWPCSNIAQSMLMVIQ